MALLVNAYVPNAVEISARAKKMVIADENSFTFGVGVGSVTVLLVGIKNACSAQVLEVTFNARVLVVKALIDEVATIQ